MFRKDMRIVLDWNVFSVMDNLESSWSLQFFWKMFASCDFSAKVETISKWVGKVGSFVTKHSLIHCLWQYNLFT